jgi:hypothetical protein
MEREREQAVLELLAEATYRKQSSSSNHTPIYGVVTGVLSARGEIGCLTVDYPGNTLGHPVPARSVVACSDSDMGREVALMFEKGDPSKPIIIGLLQSEATSATVPISAEVDGERVTLNAKQEIVLKCGKASITLTRAGKILIRGAYLLSRSSGVNRIKGGSVQIN